MLSEVRRVSSLLQQVYQSCQVFGCEENVATMGPSELETANQQLEVAPFALCLSDLAPQRRRRLFWPTWPIQVRETVVLAKRGLYTSAQLRLWNRLVTERWADEGWQPLKVVVPFPTLIRPCPVSKPRFKTSGVKTASTRALGNWWQDAHRRPPVHYGPVYQMQSLVGRRRRYKTVGVTSFCVSPSDTTQSSA